MLFIAPCLLDEKQYIKLLDRVIERERSNKVPPTHTLRKYIAFYKMYKGEFIDLGVVWSSQSTEGLVQEFEKVEDLVKAKP